MALNLFGFRTAPDIKISLGRNESRRYADLKMEDGTREWRVLFYDGETVEGEVEIRLKSNGKFSHQGITVELLGQIEVVWNRGNYITFLCLSKDIARPGELLRHQVLRFAFEDVKKPYETYIGTNVTLRYFIRVTVKQRLVDIAHAAEFVVHTLSRYPNADANVKVDMGIEDSLHLELVYNRSMYHLKDVIVGKINFVLVRIKVNRMELALLKRETTRAGATIAHECDTLAQFEVMDGSPTKGGSIPLRVFLAGHELTPTYQDVNDTFSVRYYLKVVLIDEDERRYYKQQEIFLWRKGDNPRSSKLQNNTTLNPDFRMSNFQSFVSDPFSTPNSDIVTNGCGNKVSVVNANGGDDNDDDDKIKKVGNEPSHGPAASCELCPKQGRVFYRLVSEYGASALEAVEFESDDEKNAERELTTFAVDENMNASACIEEDEDEVQ